jgi:hypothetical protein
MSKQIREYLVSECRFAAANITSHDDPRDKAYYLSAVYAAVQRAINIEFDEELMLLMAVSEWVHRSVASRVEEQVNGKNQPIGLPGDVFFRLASIIFELSARLEAEQSFVDLLGKMSSVAYTVTGNGFYLYSTNRITV